MKRIIKKVIYQLASQIVAWNKQFEKERIYRLHKLDKTVRLAEVILLGNIRIGEHTYINDWSCLTTGPSSKITIGKHNAIGRFVTITAKTHSLEMPTTSEDTLEIEHIEKDVIIGNYVWIGDRVYIKPGIKINDYAIIGSNSVVTRDVKEFEIVAGTPAKHLRFNNSHRKYNKK